MEGIEGDSAGLVTLGRVTGAHGLQGWIKVYSDTSPRERIASYAQLLLDQGEGWRRWKLAGGRRQGRYVVLKLKGCNDRNQAEALVGARIAIERTQLPELAEPGEYYWVDLRGLRVETLQGQALGRVEQLFETGANDVMVVRGERERLIPYVWEQVVREVDLDAGVMRVDWDPEF
jgi:16S rRNA processing protein RimM